MMRKARKAEKKHTLPLWADLVRDALESHREDWPEPIGIHAALFHYTAAIDRLRDELFLSTGTGSVSPEDFAGGLAEIFVIGIRSLAYLKFCGMPDDVAHDRALSVLKVKSEKILEAEAAVRSDHRPTYPEAVGALTAQRDKFSAAAGAFNEAAALEWIGILGATGLVAAMRLRILADPRELN